jgi:hypothetical protein
MTAMAKVPRMRFADFRAMISACEKGLKELASNASPVTGRLLRKPMVRGGVQSDPKPATPPQGEVTMDFPALPGDKEVGRQQQKQEPGQKGTASHRRNQPPSVTTSQIFKASPNVGGVEALEAKNPQSARHTAKPLPASADAGSEALRKILTDKIEKARTTARHRKNQQQMQALDLEVRSGGASLAAGVAPLPMSEHLRAHLPGFLLLLILGLLLVLFVLQQTH